MKRGEWAFNAKSPWALPPRDFGRPYGYAMSRSEWQSLLGCAKQGDPEAEWGVADRYDDGVADKKGRILVSRSSRNAAKWFRKSAEHGCAPAQNNLGIILSARNATHKNIEEALFWFRKAFKADSTLAATNIAITYRQTRKFRKAVHWFRVSVDSGDDDARVQLGIHYYWGKGVKKDPVVAVRCFRRAIRGKNICEAGRDDAFFYLGIAYCEGKGVRQSVATARKLFKRANIDNDHPAALKMLQKLPSTRRRSRPSSYGRL
jgi:FOG: TPR repeat, SEL1 subfamily